MGVLCVRQIVETPGHQKFHQLDVTTAHVLCTKSLSHLLFLKWGPGAMVPEGF